MDIETLSSIIRAYDASFDTQTLKSAMEHDESGALAEWAATHLTSDTLLTADELLQFEALQRSGRADHLAGLLDPATGQTFHEQEIKAAIEELHRSTEAIGKQTETLKHQQDALGRLMRNASKDAQARERFTLEHSQILALDRKAFKSSVADLSREIELRLSELDPPGNSSLAATQEAAKSLLSADDKLLSSLQKLGWELETEDPREKELVGKLQEICARLIKHSVEACRTRLDRVYLETLEASSAGNDPRTAQGEDMTTVQEELESLYSEILSVAQMSVEQQYLAPALKSVSTRNGKSAAKTASALEYIHDCLDYLLEKTDVFCARLEDFHAHRAAASQLTGIARAELAAAAEPPPKADRRPAPGASPTKPQKPSGHGSSSSPVRVRVRPGPTPKHRRRPSASGMQGEESALEQVLRMLALSLPEDDGTGAGQYSSTSPLVAALSGALAERAGKVADVSANVQSSFESNARTQIEDSALAFEVLRDSLLAESPFGEVKLVDPGIEGSIRVLEQEMGNVGARLAKVDAEVTLIRGRRGKQEELIRRWGS